MLKTESLLSSAIIMSFAVHCLIASLLFFCLKAIPLAPLPQTIISVDIRTLEPEIEKKQHVSQPPKSQPAEKLRSNPPAEITPLQAQVQKPALREKGPSPAPSIAKLIAEPPTSPPLQERNDSSDKSPRVRTNPADMTYPDKNIPSRGVEAVDTRAGQVYLATLKEIIERRKEYPLMARRGRMEGTVRISCKVSRSGELREAIIAVSSGYEILDKAALRSVRSAGRFPVVPSGIAGDPFCFVAPITFNLARE